MSAQFGSLPVFLSVFLVKLLWLPVKGTCKLCGLEPLVIARVGQPASLLCGSVLGEGSKRGRCCCLASGGLPATGPISSHFTHFLCVTDTLPAVALVVNPRVGGLVYVLNLCEPFKGTLQEIWQFLPLP